MIIDDNQGADYMEEHYLNPVVCGFKKWLSTPYTLYKFRQNWKEQGWHFGFCKISENLRSRIANLTFSNPASTWKMTI